MVLGLSLSFVAQAKGAVLCTVWPDGLVSTTHADQTRSNALHTRLMRAILVVIMMIVSSWRGYRYERHRRFHTGPRQIGPSPRIIYPPSRMLAIRIPNFTHNLLASFVSLLRLT
ncbi:hypothetical protein BDV09DRAFT_5163 [Aspergillus tetrazonus]